MNFIIPASIYSISFISKARNAYKDFLSVDVSKEKKSINLNITVKNKFDSSEKREIIGSFLNYLLQCSAIELLNLEVE